ncbi:MAG: hypothetical protein WBA38_04035 [Gordonia sp. (in: high G+C Gram-positive bacteria)]|uniref:hypothetical protein n=1 Tax=Gordonia sp. (in: high G+C Gram-positive bacteria) TaxID=84139 RepID=UPI003C778FE6
MNANMIGTILDAALKTQPWYARYANTIVMACSMLVTLGTWATATYTDLPPAVAVVIGSVVAVASVLVTRATPNGITPRGNARVVAEVDAVEVADQRPVATDSWGR